jgi:hypothetical protein
MRFQWTFMDIMTVHAAGRFVFGSRRDVLFAFPVITISHEFQMVVKGAASTLRRRRQRHALA